MEAEEADSSEDHWAWRCPDCEEELIHVRRAEP